MVSGELDSAVEGLYDAFRSASPDDRVEFCDHCVDPRQVAVLRVTPLRELTAAHLGPYLGKAITTWGDLPYFQHFLPRLLELATTGELNDWDYASFLPSRLADSWTSGTDAQREAVSDLLGAWWSVTISNGRSPCDPRDVLEVIGGCGLSATPYLDAWSVGTDEAATRRLTAFIADWTPAGHRADQVEIEIDRWMRSDAPTTLLDQITDPALADDFVQAADSLAHFRGH